MRRSLANGPMLDRELGHRKVLGITGDEPRADSDGGCRDQAVRLAQRDASRGELAAPVPGALGLRASDRSEPEAVEQPTYWCLLACAQATGNLLDVDRANVGDVLAAGAQASDAMCCTTSAERIDQDRRVKQARGHDSCRSAHAARIARALRRDPSRRILVPVVTGVGERVQRRLDVLPATLILESPTDRLPDERAAASPADSPVELCHEIVGKAYVQTHGHNLAHKTRTLGACGRSESVIDRDSGAR